MTKFLQTTAEYLCRKYGYSVSDICIVLPNRRGGLFLRKYLSECIGKTIWSPDIFSIEDFMSKLSGLTLIENTRLLFELFEVHKEVEGKAAQTFDEFITWGQQLLQDFNEIDSYLADPVQLFGFLSEARAISLWNLDTQPLTEFQKNYLRFYNSLLPYYSKLNERLIPVKQAYAGLLFRFTARQIQTLEVNITWPKIIFTGFNALTKAEENIIDTLVESGKAELIWDSDKYYMEDQNQEAGEFLRKRRKRGNMNDFNWITDDLASQPRNVTITGAPCNTAQVKYCGEILSGIPEIADETEDTAIVLMDEQLLIPLLNSLPGNINALNITMGMSLKNSPLFSFFDAVFRLHINWERFMRSSSDGKTRFYFRDVLRILQHPVMKQMSYHQTKDNRFIFDELVETIKSGNRVFLTKEDIIPVGADLFQQGLTFLDPVFTLFREPADALNCMKNVILQMRDAVINDINEVRITDQQQDSVIELEFIYGFSCLIHQVETLIAKYEAVKNLNILHQLFLRLAETTTLPFYGEPLKGIQIMGMLETRTLDFKNLIMLSVSEDLIPGSKTAHSFIPYDVRRSFDLPSYKHKNAVYAYHFYRLLQRAENIHLIYNTETDELGGGEKSRFIKQIQQELTQINPGINIIDQVLNTPVIPEQDIPVLCIEKNTEILEILKKKALSGFSPTSLNAYRRCRLQFFFSSVTGLEEHKELEDTIDQQVFGQAVHDVMFRLYQPFINKPLSSADIDSMLPLIGSIMDKAFEKKYKGSDIAFGKNLLLVKVATFLVRNFLNEEKINIEKLKSDGINVIVKLLEKQLRKTLKKSFSDGVDEIKLKGFVDRVDLLNDRIRIIDYKTGQVDKKELVLNDWEDLITDPLKDKCFQLLMYVYLLDDFTGIEGLLTEAGILSLKKVKSGFLSLTLPDGNGNQSNIIHKQSLKRFENVLVSILKEIFDPQVPFGQTENLEVCRKCPFINLCGR